MPTVYRKCSTTLIHRAIGDEYVLLNPDSGHVHKLNPAAACIWQKMSHDIDIACIALILVEHFAIDADTALADAKAFVSQLTDLDLLEQVEV